MKIGFIGLGKLGGPCAEVIARKGHTVYGYDIDSTIKLDGVHMSNNLVEMSANSPDIVFIAVPTPHDPAYDGREPTSHLPPKDFDYTIVDNILTVADSIFYNKLIVLISTVLPGTTRRQLAPLVKNNRFLYNPYLIAMGTVAWDMVNPEMVMIGTEHGLNEKNEVPNDGHLLQSFYASIMENDPRYVIGTWDEMECIKVFYNCYSFDTEVLTDNGWKYFFEANDADMVLSLDKETMVPEWVLTDKFVSRHYKGDMIHFHSSKDDVLVTPTHNMLIGKLTSYRKPIDGKKHGYSWYTMTAEEAIKRNSFTFQRSTKWHNDSKDQIEINGIIFDTAYFVQFMAWFLSEGCVSDGRVIISQDNEHNKEKYESILEVIHHIYNGPYKICESKSYISVLWREFGEYLKQFGKSFDKFVPDEIKNLGVDMIRLFLDTYNLGDGSSLPWKSFKGGVEYNKRYKYYATSSDKMAADLGELIIKVGRFPSYRKTRTELSNKECHLVYELIGKTSVYQKSSTVGLKYSVIDYDDMVYCAMLPKNHIFLTRRNGKCTWQGNTFISMKIGLVNMIQDVAVKQGNINVDVVTKALANSNHRIISDMYMKAGMGDGGNCHPRDNIALRWMAQELDLGYDLFGTIMEAREVQAKNMADFLMKYKLPIVILGKSYKPGVDYEEGSSSILVGSFIDSSFNLSYDTIMDKPTTYLLAHPKREIDVEPGSIVVDPWRQVVCNSGVEVVYYGNTRS